MARWAFGYWGAEFFNFLQYDERLEVIRECIPQSESVDREPLLSADDVPDEPMDVAPTMVWSPLQLWILKALDGRALKKEQLAAEVFGDSDHGTKLYRAKKGLTELKACKIVVNTIGIGYWRTDSPPSTRTGRTLTRPIYWPKDWRPGRYRPD